MNQTSISPAQTTVDHEEIRQWVENRGGRPATLRDTDLDGTTALHIVFPEDIGNEDYQEISWDEFFKLFDERKLAFVYQDENTESDEMRSFAFVRREDQNRNEMDEDIV